MTYPAVDDVHLRASVHILQAALTAHRLAIFLPKLSGGGAERNVLLVAGGLVDIGWDVELVVGVASGPMLDNVPPGVTLTSLGRPSVTRAIGALRRHLRETRPEILLSALTHANLSAIVAARTSGVPLRVVVSERNHLSSQLDYPVGRRQRLYPPLIRLLYPKADCVIAVTERVGRDLVDRTGIDPAKVVAINNPLPHDELAARAAEPFDHPWAGDGGPPIVLGVGSLYPQKDFTSLVRAVAAARQPCRLLILGEGPDRALLEATAAEHGIGDRLSLPGYLGNPYPAYREAGVFVLSSRFEGLPTALLEAMSLGRPVVATDCPSGPREVLDGQPAGALVGVEDPVAMGRAIDAALEGGGGLVTYDLAPYEPGEVVRRYAAHLSGAPMAADPTGVR